MQFHEKNFIDLFDFTSFFAWTFLNFLSRCETIPIKTWQDDSLICDIDCHPFNWFEFEHMSCVGGPKYILFPLWKKPNKKGREL